MKFSTVACCVLLSLFSAEQAAAQATATHGTISRITLSGANNYAFRIYLRDGGVDKLASCANSFAYINSSDSNYQAKAGSLLAAAAQGKAIAITYSRDASNWCQITDLETTY